MITELQEYAEGRPAPYDSKQVQLTIKYLKALNSLFERGVLGKMAYINSVEKNPVLRNMDQGFDFFLKWWTEKKSQGINNGTCNI